MTSPRLCNSGSFVQPLLDSVKVGALCIEYDHEVLRNSVAGCSSKWGGGMQCWNWWRYYNNIIKLLYLVPKTLTFVGFGRGDW